MFLKLIMNSIFGGGILMDFI